MGLALLRKLFSFLSSLWALADIVLDSVTIINYRAACQVSHNITTPHYPQPCAVRGDQLQLLRPRHPLHVPPRPVRHPLLHGATGQGERGVRVRAGVCPHYHPPIDSISKSTWLYYIRHRNEAPHCNFSESGQRPRLGSSFSIAPLGVLFKNLLLFRFYVRE